MYSKLKLQMEINATAKATYNVKFQKQFLNPIKHCIQTLIWLSKDDTKVTEEVHCRSVYLYLHHTHCLVLQCLIIPSTFRGEYPRAHFCSSGGTLPRLQFPGLHRYIYLTDLLEWVKSIWSVISQSSHGEYANKHSQLLLFKCLKLFFPLWWRHWNVSGFCCGCHNSSSLP